MDSTKPTESLEPAVGAPAPTFTLAATGGQTLALADLKGQRVVLYFYPKANTPGCTREGQDFSALAERFAALNTRILGISRDGVQAQENFKAKQSFAFDLLADPEQQVCKAYGVLKEKKMYGKTGIGVERSTFLIDEHGVLRQAWRKVTVDGHAEAVLAAVEALDQTPAA